MFAPAFEVRLGQDADGIALSDALAFRRVAAQAEACELAALARYAATLTTAEAREFAPLEVAAALRISETAARDRLSLAVALDTRLSGTFAELRAGRIDAYRARLIATATEDLTDEQAATVETRVLPRAAEQAPARLRETLRRTVLRVDAAAAERRRQQRVAARRVNLYSAEDGEAVLTVHGPAERTHAAHQHLRALAQQLRDQGAAEGRTLDQLAADVALDLLAGKDLTHTKVNVWVTVPATTLLGVDHQPGYLAGYGEITAHTALQLAATTDATWRRILHDPATGHVIDVGRSRYRPPAGLADHVRARTPTCTAPGCVRPAQHCDLDHAIPFPTGPTNHTNLHPSCRHHHRAKTTGGWKVATPRPGHTIWISPAGYHYPHQPDPIAEPSSESDPDPPK